MFIPPKPALSLHFSLFVTRTSPLKYGVSMNTSAEDMQVVTVDTAAFRGDLLGIGLQDCGLPDQPPGLAGLDLWDVTDPANPAHLGFFDSGGYSPASTSSPSPPGRSTEHRGCTR
jgi:hypothetical protein